MAFRRIGIYSSETALQEFTRQGNLSGNLAKLTHPKQIEGETEGCPSLQSGWPGLYLPLQLRNPVFIDDLDPRGVTPSEYVDSGMRQLDAKAVRYILWSPRLDSPGLGKVDNHLAKFREYLETHYKQVRSFPDADQLWERRSGQ